MPQTVDRESLLQTLESVQAGIASRETAIDQSSCFAVSGGRVHTYNDIEACSAPSPLPPGFEGAIRAQKCLDILRKLPDKELEIEVADGQMILVGKRKRVGLRVEEKIELPIDAIKLPKKWKPLHPDFGEAVATVGSCAGTNEAEFLSVCINVHPKWLEAADKFQVCRWKIKTDVENPTLVRQSSLQHVSSLGMTEFAESDSWLHFRNPNGLVLSCRRYVEDYKTAEITEILKVEGAAVTLPKGLVDAVDNAAVFSSEEQGGRNLVMVELKPGKLKIRGEGTSGWYSEIKKVQYDGEPMTFYCSPALLAGVVQKKPECVIAPGRLKIDAGRWQYVTCLIDPESLKVGGSEKEEAEPEPEE